MKNNKKVLVVGAGLGGLATALRLTKQGYNVEIVEKFYQAGGRLNQIKKDGFTFDTGPSFFSMSYEFESFANDCGIQLPFKYYELDPLYSVNFKNNDKTFYLYKDIKKLSAQFEGIEPDFEQKMLKYLNKCEKIFNDTVDIVIKKNFNSLFDYFFSLMTVNPVHLPVLFKSFWQEVCSHFSSEEARQIVSLVAFFLGRTPFDTMAIYTLLSYTEFKHDGYYNVEGGMYKIVEGLVNELKKENVVFNYNVEIVDFETNDGKISALIDSKGKSWESEVFLINADAAVFRSKVFKNPKFTEKKMNKMSWTMGYLTFYLGINRKLESVNHHNYFLGNNYKEYADNVMKNPDTLEKPYYYVNVLSKSNADCAPDSSEGLFFVCPVPNLKYKNDWSDRDKIVDSIIDDFSDRINVNIREHIVSKTIFTPEEWKEHFNLHYGAGLGLSHNMMQIGALRPANFDEKYKNVFYVGASTVPGAGLPMSIISSKLAYERIVNY